MAFKIIHVLFTVFLIVAIFAVRLELKCLISVKQIIHSSALRVRSGAERDKNQAFKIDKNNN